jgi:SAM-dependent methyltransferase
MTWTCVLCSSRNVGSAKLDRESSLCRGCSSTWRARAITLTIITGLGYDPTRLNRLSPDWSRIGLGISDDVEVASRLSMKFSYTNTFFDGFPHLDIRNIPLIAKNSFEFVSCSDVLEHVDVNLDKAIRGLSKLLKPGGFAVLSVPINPDAEKVEFYPNLRTFKVMNGLVNGEIIKEEVLST